MADPGGAQGRSATGAAPLPREDIGALIARIGNGEPFVVGESFDSLYISRSGRLFLTVNDDVLQDNSGQFQVSVVIAEDRRR